ncbi:MAG: hypothetical protein WCI77_07200 [Candidatus Omnitrophota bacterium]
MQNNIKPIIVVTATYARPARTAYIKRCIKVFKKVNELFWIVVEDADTVDDGLREVLSASKINHIYLNFGPTGDLGNSQKNLAFTYIRNKKMEGVVYCADDDNWWDDRLFDEIRKIKRVGIFPVGNLGPRGIETPIVKNNIICGWDADWKERKFCIDWAGFAFNAAVLQGLSDPILKGYAEMPNEKKSLQFLASRMETETQFLEKFIHSPHDLELLCDECSKCYAWHNQSVGEYLWLTRLKRLQKRLINLFKIKKIEE